MSLLQSVLSPEMSVLQHSSLCFTWTNLFNSSLCCARRWSTATCGAPGQLDCLSTRASAAPRRVCLQELLCAPEVSVDYIEHVLHYSCPSIRALCCTWKCLSSRACAAFVHFCLAELCAAPVLVCSLQEFCAALGRVCLQ